MSKELKAFRKICKNLNSYEFTDEYKKNKKLIEKALEKLKDLEYAYSSLVKDFNSLSKDDEKTKKELSKEIEKNRALEIIKKYPRCSLQRYIGFNEMVKDGYELTSEHLFNYDMPCSVEEYNIVIEALL